MEILEHNFGVINGLAERQEEAANARGFPSCSPPLCLYPLLAPILLLARFVFPLVSVVFFLLSLKSDVTFQKRSLLPVL